MKSRDKFAADLARLAAVRADPTAPEAAAELERALSARSNLLVARAAEIVTEWALGQYAPQLAAAFERFLEDPDRDPTCAAKLAIAAALNSLEVRDAELFLRGARHAQPEPVWGGTEDTAASLRAECALGLARSDPPQVLIELARLLADPESDARIGTARAIAYASRPGGAPLLAHKCFIGDEEPAVMVEVYGALLALEPEAGLELVGEKTRATDDPSAEAAVIALGASRLPGALPLLQDVWVNGDGPGLRRAALRAAAGHGSDEAFAFLLDLLSSGTTYEAAEALDALRLMRDDDRRRRKVERALSKRDDLPR